MSVVGPAFKQTFYYFHSFLIAVSKSLSLKRSCNIISKSRVCFLLCFMSSSSIKDFETLCYIKGNRFCGTVSPLLISTGILLFYLPGFIHLADLTALTIYNFFYFKIKKTLGSGLFEVYLPVIN